MARTNRELDKWFDHNVDLDNRTIYMGSSLKEDDGESGVDNLMAESFIKGMHALETRSTEQITILMNNPGGDWYHGMAIYDAIQTSTCYCTIKVYGQAMSMGSIILQAADSRIMMPNSRLMMHYGDGGIIDHAKTAEKWIDELKRINHEMENLYLQSMLNKEEKEGHGYLAKIINKLTDKTYSFSKTHKQEDIRVALKEMLNFDLILTAEETVALGLADEIYINNNQ